MPAQAIAINAISWTPITTAGENSICWLIREPQVGRVLIDHSESGTGSLDIDKSYSLASNKEVIKELLADSSSDVFYAICRNPNQTAVIVVDNIVDIESSVSDQNGSDIPLSAGAEFTGEWVKTVSFGIGYVSVYSDVDSVEDGLIVEQSTDGIHAHFDDVFTIIGTKGKNFAINLHAEYLRVRYINGPSDQTDFHLQTIFKKDGLASTHRVKDDITTDDDARLVKSILSIKANDQNQYKNIELNNPMPVNSGQLFQSDINLTYSNMYNFVGSPIDVSKDRWTPIIDSTATNPKLLRLEFERPIQTAIIGITTETGSFSNTVIKYGLTTSPSFTLVDESADSTLKTLLVAPSVPITLTRIEFEFHTANTITLTGINLGKSTNVIAQLQGIDPDGELLTVGTSRIGNLNVGIQEYGDTSSIDAFARLRIAQPYTLLDSKQLHDKQPLFWDEIVAGTATSVHSSVNACTVMTVGASTSDYVIRQTKTRPNYQPGKSLKNGEPVLTIDGFKPIEEITVGDVVFDGNGQQTTVTGVYPQGIREIYRIKFDDGTHVDCDGEHLWKTIIRQGKEKGNPRIKSTNDMLSEYGEKPPVFARWRIPKAPIIEIEKKDIPIDPYTLGAILGDGHIYGSNSFVSFTTADREILEYLICDGISTLSHKFGYGLKGLSQQIISLSLNGKTCENKFIPNDYLFNNYDCRLSVLKGLMDTDGSVDKRDGTCEFNSASKELAEGLAFIVRSIGGQAKIRKRSSFYRNDEGEKVQCLDSYRVRVISPVCPFRLERKAIYWKKRERISFDRYVHTIKKIGSYHATCIRVDSDDHTFLTRNNIVTHNSQLIVLTGHFTQQPGVTIQAGAFDGTGAQFRTPYNGIFIEVTENSVSWNIAKNGTTTETVTQANWNYDPMDGTGPSGLTLDLDALEIFFFDIEWLGAGRVRCGGFIRGLPRYMHFFNHANDPAFTSVYMSTPNLPLRYYIESDGTGGGSLDHICSTVISEGGIQQTGVLRSVNTGTTHLDANLADTKYAIIGIRLNSTYYDITVLPEYFSMISETNDDFKWTIELNPVIAGTFTYNGITDSSVEFALGNTTNTVTTPGIIFDSGFSKSSATIDRKFVTSLNLGSTIAGVQDTLVLTVTPLSSNADIQSSLTFRELL